jgi:hypothetical protein
MIYRLEKAHAEGMRIIKKEGEGHVNQKMYSTNMVSRLAIPLNKILAKTGTYDTGLTELQEGEFEEMLGHEKGYLGKKSKFWNSYGIKIPAQGLTLNTESPEDALTIAIVKARAKTVGDVALTAKELKTNANAKWLLSSTEAEAMALTDTLTFLAKAAVKFDSMNNEDCENYLKSKNLDPRGMSPVIIRGKVAEDVHSSPKKFLALATDKHQADKIFIQELIMYGIIRMNKNSYLDMDENVIAYSQEEMLTFIGNKANAKATLGWKRQLEELKK